jgi:hypothetical protein
MKIHTTHGKHRKNTKSNQYSLWQKNTFYKTNDE